MALRERVVFREWTQLVIGDWFDSAFKVQVLVQLGAPRITLRASFWILSKTFV